MIAAFTELLRMKIHILMWRTVTGFKLNSKRLEAIDLKKCFHIYLFAAVVFLLKCYTRLALNYLLRLQREGTGLQQDSELIHP